MWEGQYVLLHYTWMPHGELQQCEWQQSHCSALLSWQLPAESPCVSVAWGMTGWQGALASPDLLHRYDHDVSTECFAPMHLLKEFTSNISTQISSRQQPHMRVPTRIVAFPVRCMPFMMLNTQQISDLGAHCHFTIAHRCSRVFSSPLKATTSGIISHLNSVSNFTPFHRKHSGIILSTTTKSSPRGGGCHT